MKNSLVSRALLGFFALFLSACSSIGNNSQSSITGNIQSVPLTVPAVQQRVVIYNHGISRPQQVEPCFMPYNNPPRSLLLLNDYRTLVYKLCSTSTESPAISSAGKQVYLRKKEIDFAIDAFLARGIQPKNLFLAGHSNGAWTSLMMMKDVNKRFNGVIAFAPAFAGRRSEASYAPWWRKTVRPNQIKEMLNAPQMDAIVFAYENDAFNRPQELQFLANHYPQRNSSGVNFVAYDCGLRNAHQTFRKDCRLAETHQQIKQFIEQQISSW